MGVDSGPTFFTFHFWIGSNDPGPFLKKGGIIMWILRLNMSDRTYRLEEVPEAYKNLGGRGMTSTLVHDEVPPLCHPLGP